ncbi:TetR/AcrR family transcriptional regulator [Streptomyces sp. A7024]|uniref:TetR/AcrR family transcriptional regulator n=1 Tax=Streptomyces coryli TaxID=1128680 RepID=A0A6G4TUM4_9ACTN|nr:TetR/AcrR family transcriptional regulator [Streptomyces coryli]
MVDPEQRRAELAEAVWRVITRDGLDHASIRNVAAEAGLSAGSLRHFFPSHSALLEFAMRLVMDRITQRIEALPAAGDPHDDVLQVLSEFLPLDKRRRIESEVWLAFTARALVDPPLRALRDEAYDLLRAACLNQIGRLTGPGAALDADLETDRLYALIDGLLVHGVTRPARATPTTLLAVLDHHLRELAARAHPS